MGLTLYHLQHTLLEGMEEREMKIYGRTYSSAAHPLPPYFHFYI